MNTTINPLHPGSPGFSYSKSTENNRTENQTAKSGNPASSKSKYDLFEKIGADGRRSISSLSALYNINAKPKVTGAMIPVKEIVEKLDRFATDYIAGNASLSELPALIEEACQVKKQYHVEMDIIDGSDPYEDMRNLHGVRWEIMHQIQTKALAANYAEGKALANQYGGGSDWAYYNSDYYHLIDKAQQVVVGEIDRLATEKNVDLKPYTPFSPVGTFNDMWDCQFGLNSRNAKMRNTGEIPPKDFVFFHKATKYSQEDFAEGTAYYLTGTDPFSTGNQSGEVTWRINVPRGQSLFKDTTPRQLRNLVTTLFQDGHSMILDEFLPSRETGSLEQRLYKLMRENFNTFEDGVFLLRSRGVEKSIDVPYVIMGPQENVKEHFNGSELIHAGDFPAENESEILSYLKNFEVFTKNYGHSNRFQYWGG